MHAISTSYVESTILEYIRLSVRLKEMGLRRVNTNVFAHTVPGYAVIIRRLIRSSSAELTLEEHIFRCLT